MFINQLTLTSFFSELHFSEELLTAVGATKEGDNFSCMTGQIGKLTTNMEFVKVHQPSFKICSVHVSLQFNEFHLAIIRTVFH